LAFWQSDPLGKHRRLLVAAVLLCSGVQLFSCGKYAAQSDDTDYIELSETLKAVEDQPVYGRDLRSGPVGIELKAAVAAVDIAAMVAAIELTLEVPQLGSRGFHEATTSVARVAQTDTPKLVITPRGAVPRLSIADTISFDSKQLISDSITRWYAVIHLPVLGDSKQFPEDWYWLRATFELLMANDDGEFVIVPLRVRPGITRHVGPFVAKVAPFNKESVRQVIDVVLTRGRMQRAFIYLLFLALVVVSSLILVNLWRGVPDEGEEWSVVTAVAALALSIVPLRSIFVPQELSPVTRLDLMLGTVAGMLFAAALAAIASAILRSKEHGEQHHVR